MILVVDDSKELVDVLGDAIRREGFRVETAKDGVEAFGHLRDPDCKCMLLDVGMPRINGVELLLLMQSEGIVIPVILMSGFDDFDEKEMMQFSNVVKFIKKPFKMHDVVEAVKRHALV